jgi:hypothetical protein
MEPSLHWHRQEWPDTLEEDQDNEQFTKHKSYTDEIQELDGIRSGRFKITDSHGIFQ